MSGLMFNGSFVESNKNWFEEDNRLWQFGEGLFESIRVMDGEIPLLNLHAERLTRSAKILGWAISPFWNAGFWQEHIMRFCKHHKWTNARVKIIVFRQGAGAYLPDTEFFNWLITGSALESNKFELNELGIRTKEFSHLPKPADYLSLLKTTSSIRYVQAARFAFQNGVDDVLVTNQFERFCEASSSNLFIVQGATLLTPPLSEYCLDGVMRRAVIQLAQDNGIECLQTSLFRNDICYADELFLTNAIKGIQWVGSFEDSEFELGSMTRKLLGLLQQL